MSRVTRVDTRRWKVAQTVSHVMQDHMSSSRVMYGVNRWCREEMVKHEVERKNIAVVNAWYYNIEIALHQGA